MQTTNFKNIVGYFYYLILPKPLHVSAIRPSSRRKHIIPREDSHTTETCSGYYWIKYSEQCCVRRKPWTWRSTRNRMQTTNFKNIVGYFYYLILPKPLHVSVVRPSSCRKYITPPEDGHTTETCSGYYWIKYSKQCCVRRKPWTWPSTCNRMQTTNFKINICAHIIHNWLNVYKRKECYEQ
jgi:hypothetical protein